MNSRIATFAYYVMVLFASLMYAGVAYSNTNEDSDSCRIALLDDAQLPLDFDTELSDLEKNVSLSLALKKGENRIFVACNLSRQSILNFERYELIDIRSEKAGAPLQRLKATSPSFILPVGEFNATFTLLLHNADVSIITWSSIEDFFNQSLINNITMSAFYGLCMVLILYVWFMGRILKDHSFVLYSLYVFFASTFFLLQEGQLHIFLPDQAFILGHYFYILFAGLTVFSATIFITRITDIYNTWPKINRYLLNPCALFILSLSVTIVLGEHNLVSSWAGVLMAYLTLTLMTIILVLVIWQTIRKVQMAWLVCLSLLLMVIAMAMRVLPIGVGDFLTRYGLILAFALEAFIFAIVVSLRIQGISTAKKQAETEANTDLLCNVLNRRGWMNRTNDLLSAQREQGGLLSLFYIDLDNFKQINDTYGHEIGDKVLTIVAKIIRNQSREKDVVGRVGGDEFVVVGHFEFEYEAEGIAIRLQERLQDLPLQINDTLKLTVCASVGHVMFDSPQESVQKMLSLADQSMYENKRNSKRESFFGLVN
jgi:diguanylate cyclase (GGDEF)-like protein